MGRTRFPSRLRLIRLQKTLFPGLSPHQESYHQGLGEHNPSRVAGIHRNGLVLTTSKTDPSVKRWRKIDEGEEVAAKHPVGSALLHEMGRYGGGVALSRHRAEHRAVRDLHHYGYIDLKENPSHHMAEFSAHLTDKGRQYLKKTRASETREAHERQGGLFGMEKGAKTLMIPRYMLRKAGDGATPAHSPDPGMTAPVMIPDHMAKNPGGSGFHHVKAHYVTGRHRWNAPEEKRFVNRDYGDLPQYSNHTAQTGKDTTIARISSNYDHIEGHQIAIYDADKHEGDLTAKGIVRHPDHPLYTPGEYRTTRDKIDYTSAANLRKLADMHLNHMGHTLAPEYEKNLFHVPGQGYGFPMSALHGNDDMRILIFPTRHEAQASIRMTPEYRAKVGNKDKAIKSLKGKSFIENLPRADSIQKEQGGSGEVLIDYPVKNLSVETTRFHSVPVTSRSFSDQDGHLASLSNDKHLIPNSTRGEDRNKLFDTESDALAHVDKHYSSHKLISSFEKYLKHDPIRDVYTFAASNLYGGGDDRTFVFPTMRQARAAIRSTVPYQVAAPNDPILKAFRKKHKLDYLSGQYDAKDPDTLRMVKGSEVAEVLEFLTKGADRVVYRHPETGDPVVGSVLHRGEKGITVTDEEGRSTRIRHGEYTNHKPTDPPPTGKPTTEQAGGLPKASEFWRRKFPGLTRYPDDNAKMIQPGRGKTWALRWKDPAKPGWVYAHDRAYAREHARARFAGLQETDRDLPQLREATTKHLSPAGFGRSKVVAGAVRLLEKSGIPAEQLLKLEIRADMDRGVVDLGEWKNKDGSKARPEVVHDNALARLVDGLGRVRGTGALWAYQDHRGEWHELTPKDLDDYTGRHLGDDKTTKHLIQHRLTRAWAEEAEGRGRSDKAIHQHAKRAARSLGHDADTLLKHVDPTVIHAHKMGGEPLVKAYQHAKHQHKSYAEHRFSAHLTHVGRVDPLHFGVMMRPDNSRDTDTDDNENEGASE